MKRLESGDIPILSALKLAVLSLSLETVIALIKKNEKPVDITYLDLSYSTLSKEQEIKRVKIVKLLIAAGLSPLVALQARVFSDYDLMKNQLLPLLEKLDDDEFNQTISPIVLSVAHTKPNYPFDERTVNLFFTTIYPRCINLNCYDLTCINCVFYGNSAILKAITALGFEPKTYLLNRAIDKLSYAQQKNSPFVSFHTQVIEILIEQQIRSHFLDILDKISEHRFELNGGGDTSITEIDHPISTKAAKVFKLINTALTNKLSVCSQFNAIIDEITNTLSAASLSTNSYGDWFWQKGKRSATTALLYTEIVQILVHCKSLHLQLPQKQRKVNS